MWVPTLGVRAGEDLIEVLLPMIHGRARALAIPNPYHIRTTYDPKLNHVWTKSGTESAPNLPNLDQL